MGAETTVRLGTSFKPRSLFNPVQSRATENGNHPDDPHAENLSERLHQLVRNYRGRGHIIAGVNPLGADESMSAGIGIEFLRLYGKRA